jgi:hypothetical protein
MDECRVKACHAAQLNYCTRGQGVLLSRYNIDPVQFFGEGVPVSQVQHINNALIRNVVRQALKEWEQINGKA